MAARLTATLALGLVGFWLLAMATAAVVLHGELNEVFDAVLQETAQRLLVDIQDHEGANLARLGPNDPAIVPPAIPHEEYITYHLLAPDGRVLLRSHGAAETLPPGAPAIGFSDDAGARVYVEPSVDGRYLLRIAEPPDHRGHAIRTTMVELALPLCGLVLAALLLIPWTVRRSLAPVGRLQDEIGRRGGDDLTTIEDLGLPPELAPIRDDVNLLIQRLHHALEAERSFTANAAHELRTPVATAYAQAQRLLDRLPPDDAGHRNAVLMVEGLRRLSQRLEKLLQLARAEAAVAMRLEPVDLLIPLQLIVEEFAGRPEIAGRITLDDGGLPLLMVASDMDALAIALRNLIENALIHGAADQPVTVRVTGDRCVHVVNGGPIVPPARLAALPGRFVSSGGKGSGLGLSIVQAIAQQISARLTLRSPAVGRDDGFEAVLALPPVRS